MSVQPVPAESATRGRPVDEELSQRILACTVALLAEVGFSALRIESVAQAVGCGKTAIYRRWDNKADLTADALVSSSKLGEIFDGPDVVENLCGHAWVNVENQEQMTRSGRLGSSWSAVTDPEVRDLFWERFLSKRRAMGYEILQRAVRRGEISARIDPDLVLDAVAGLTLYRGSVRISPLSRADFAVLVRRLLELPPKAP